MPLRPEILEHFLYASGLTAQGCWDELDSYDREAITRALELAAKWARESPDQDRPMRKRLESAGIWELDAEQVTAPAAATRALEAAGIEVIGRRDHHFLADTIIFTVVCDSDQLKLAREIIWQHNGGLYVGTAAA